MNAVSQYVLILAVQASVISAIAYLAIAILRKSTVTVHAIGIACTLLLLASPALVAVLPFNGLIASAFTNRHVTNQESKHVETPAVIESTSQQSLVHATAMEPEGVPIGYPIDTLATPPAEAYAPAEPQQTQSTLSSGSSTSLLRLSNLPILLGSLWLIGAVCLASIRTRGYWRLRLAVMGTRAVDADAALIAHLRRVFGRDVEPEIRVCDAITVPFVFGVIRPRIYLPSSIWALQSDRQDVVTHEIAHIIRHDPWHHLSQRIVSTLYWWQPLIHAVNRRISSARETIADNYVLRGSDCSSYASTLLAVAEHCVDIRSTRHAIAFMADEPVLEQRVAAILDEARPLQVRSSTRVRAVIAAIAVVLIVTGGGIGTSTFRSVAQEVDSESKPRIEVSDSTSGQSDQASLSASGRILDAQGNPVSDCLLVVRVYARDGAEQILSTRSDSQGTYKIDLPAILYLRSHQGWAYKEGYNMRTVFFAVPLWKKITTGLDITLPDQESTEVSIVSPQGDPLSDVVVRPDTYWVPMSQFADIPKDPFWGSDRIPEEVTKQIQMKTNAEGKARLAGISPSLVFRLKTVSKKFGDQEFETNLLNKFNQSAKFHLSPTHYVRGVLQVKNPARFQGKVIELRSKGGASPQLNQPNRESINQPVRPGMLGSGYARVELDANGQFQVPAMAIGEISASFEGWGQDGNVVPILASKQRPHFLGNTNPQEEQTLEFSLMRTVKIQGRLLKADTKDPIANACVCFYNRNFAMAAQSSTDEQGKFSINVPPGAAEGQVFHLSSLLDDYDLPRDFTITVDPSEDTMQIDNLLADPWPRWIVHLSDDDGSPMANQDLALTYQRTDQPRTIYIRGKSDAAGNAPMRLSKKIMPSIDQGEFSFYLTRSADTNEVDPNGGLKVNRRTDSEIWLSPSEAEDKHDPSAVTREQSNAREKANQPHQSDKPSVRTASGRILDTKGNPVPDCLLIAETKSKQEISVRSDDQGNYTITFPAEEHFPGDYRAWAYKQGYNARPLHFGKYLNKQQNATGADVVLPDLTSVRVKVLSPSGEPLQGARVGPYYYDLPNGSFSTDLDQGMGGPPVSSLWQQTAALTDADGFATLSGYSQKLIGGLSVRTSEYGDQICYSNLTEGLPTLHLKPVGSIHGVLLTDDPKKFEGQVIRLEGNRGLPSEVRSDMYVSFDSHGEFHVQNFAEGKLGLRFYNWDNKFDVLPTLSNSNLEVQASKELKLQFKLIKGVKITGRIVKSDTKKPIADTWISLWDSASISSPSIYTKDDGGFVAYVAPGTVRISANSFGPTGQGYDYPEPTTIQVTSEQEAISLKSLAATPYQEIEFSLKNADGSPMASQDFAISRGRPYHMISLRAKTDELGLVKKKLSKFYLRDISDMNVAPSSFDSSNPSDGFYLMDGSESTVLDPEKKLNVTSMIGNKIHLSPIAEK